MRTEKINGVKVPYDKTTDELEQLLLSCNMSDFVVYCEALSYKTDEKSFELLENYITDKDKYKRLCILKTIFRHPCSSKLKNFLEESILSDDIWFAENGLKNAYEHDFDISDEIILTAVFKHLKNLYCTFLRVLKKIKKNDDNYLKLIELFNKSENCGQKEVLSEILCEKYLPEKAEDLFDLFSKDCFSKVRLLAVKIGRKYGFNIENFKFDDDGHVRNETRK